MKIAIYNVTTAVKVGGIETFCWEIGKALYELGNDVEIISGEGKELQHSFLKLTIFPFRDRTKFPNFGTRFRKLMERLSFFKNARSYLRNNSWDIFLITKPFDFVTTFYVKKYCPECIIVFVSGGEDFWWFDRWFAKSVDIFVSVSKANAKIIQKRYSREVEIVSNGVDTEKFRPDNNLKIEIKRNFSFDKKKVLLSVGRIVGWKGYQLVIKALNFLPEEYVYIIIGEGEYLPKLRALSQELGVGNRVFFLGKKKHSELPKYYLLGDIFLQPSIGEEAFGITIIEAMATGLPVVGSRSGGIKELIKEGANGYLFDYEGKEHLSELIQKIKLAFERKEELGKKARAFVEKSYTWRECAKNLLSVIRRER